MSNLAPVSMKIKKGNQMKKQRYTVILLFIASLACQSSEPVIPTMMPVEEIIALTSAAANAQTAQALPTSTVTIIPTNTFESSQTPPAIAPTPPQSCIRPQEPQIARVVEVVDGDTIRVEINGIIYPVRYIGIDTPESTTQIEPFGKEASQKNTELVSGQTVTMYRDISETDQFDRILRFVFVGDKFINYEMVKQGYAKAFRYPPDTSCADLFQQAQDEASAQGIGMWMAQATFEASAPAQTIIIIAVNKSAEYVDIQNRSNQPIDLTGWRLDSEKGSQSCTLSGTIQPGATLRIWAMSGEGFSCGFGNNIWNNSEPDPAVLYNPQNIEISRYP